MRSRIPPPFIIRIRFGGRGGEFTVLDEFCLVVWFWGIKPVAMFEISLSSRVVLSIWGNRGDESGEIGSFFPSLSPIKNTIPREQAQGSPILRKIRILIYD